MRSSPCVESPPWPNMTCCDLAIVHRDQSGNFRRTHCHVDLVVARVGEGVGVKYFLDPVKPQQEKMERRAVLLANLDARLVTLVVSLMLQSASHSPRIQVNVQAMNYVASIVRLRAQVSLQMKDCSPPREAKKTGMLYPLQRAEPQREMIRRVASLHWQQGGEGEVASVSWAPALVLVVKLAMRKPSSCARSIGVARAILSPCQKRSKPGALLVTRVQAQTGKGVCV